MTQLWELYKLQQLDEQMEELESRKASEDSGAPLENEISEEKKTVEDTKSALKKNQSQLKNWELEVQSLTSQKKAMEDKLYSGTTTSSKELSGWQHEIDQQEQKQSKIEEKMLYLMEENDSLEKKLKSLETDLTEKENQYNSIKEKFLKEQWDIEKSIENLAQRRLKMIEAIDNEVLNKYENTRRQKGGLAVVKVNKGSCGGCFMNIPDAIIKKVMVRNLEFCNHCGRILYTDGE